MNVHLPLGVMMEAELSEQAVTLGNLVSRRATLQPEIKRCFREPLAGTVIVARGSSDHAATCGRYLLEVATRRPAASTSPSLHLLYKAQVNFSNYVVIAVSQSGRTPEIAMVLERAKVKGARTIAVTNEADSPLAQVADIAMLLEVGEEKAIPATKTVTAEIACFAMIAQAVGDVGIAEHHWDALSGHVAEVIADRESCRELAAWVSGANNRLATVARGYLYGAAAECALKIQETTPILASCFSAADLRHGPIALAFSGLPILAFMHPGPAAQDVERLVDLLRRESASVRSLGPLANSSAAWSPEIPEALATIPAVIRGQQLALGLARLNRHDPDSPGGLTKVTLA